MAGHPAKLGLVTVPGKPGDYLGPGKLEQRLQTGRTEIMKKYLIVVENTATGFSACSPDLPGCVSTGTSSDEVQQNMREAIAFHLDGLREEGQAIQEPHTFSA